MDVHGLDCVPRKGSRSDVIITNLAMTTHQPCITIYCQ